MKFSDAEIRVYKKALKDKEAWEKWRWFYLVVAFCLWPVLPSVLPSWSLEYAFPIYVSMVGGAYVFLWRKWNGMTDSQVLGILERVVNSDVDNIRKVADQEYSKKTLPVAEQ